MPVFNAERYVSDAIESIRQQTFTDFEFLIIDDGSTDRSADIIREHAVLDPRIKTRYRGNNGVVATLNEALDWATGEYIARMDADDVSLPDRLRQQVAHMRSHPDCVAVGSAFIQMDEDDAIIEQCSCPLLHAEIDAMHLNALGVGLPHPGVLIRADAIRRVGGYRRQFETAEDYDLWLRLGEIGELNNLPEPLLKYRFHLESASKRQLARLGKIAWDALHEARQRRALPPLLKPEDSSESTLDVVIISCINGAFYSRNYATARKHLFRLLRTSRWSARRVRLLLKVLPGPLAWHILRALGRVPKHYIRSVV